MTSKGVREVWDSDEWLIKGMEQQSTQAFRQFYERYIDYVYRIVIGIVKNHDQALDLCQELFIEYYDKAHTFNAERGSVKAWIAVRARSRSLDYVRKNGRETELSTAQPIYEQTTPSAQELFLRKEERTNLIEFLFKLPDKQRNAIVDHYMNELTHQEIANKVNKPLGSIKSSIRYGLNKLRQYYTSGEGYEKRGESSEDQPSNG